MSISFDIEWDMIVETVFLSILNQIEFHLDQNRKENCHHDHIPFNMKGNGNLVFSVCRSAIFTTTRRIMQETGVSRSHRSPIKDPPETPRKSRQNDTESEPLLKLNLYYRQNRCKGFFFSSFDYFLSFRVFLTLPAAWANSHRRS